MSESTPTQSPQLIGKWDLDFCDAADVLSFSVLPLNVGDVYQSVSAGSTNGDFQVLNGLELLPLGSGALASIAGVRPAAKYVVEARCVPFTETKLQLVFVGVRVQPVAAPWELPAVSGTLPDPAISLLQDLVGERVFLETTYLDEDLRIGRGPGRELYVLSKRDAVGAIGEAS